MSWVHRPLDGLIALSRNRIANMNGPMKAVRLSAYGGPEVLEYVDVPMPEIGPADVLVRVLATTISLFDIKYRRGDLRGVALQGRNLFKLPMQLGRDTAGVVEAVGPQVSMFHPGDRVVGLTSPSNPLSPLTIRGFSNLSTHIDLPGHSMFGSNAQFVARPESYWMHLPTEVEYPAAAAAMWAYATSLRILTDRLASRMGDLILVVGGSGGMGSATIDLAKAAGVQVAAVTRSASKVDFLRKRGAANVFVLPQDSVAAAIRSTGDPLGLDGAVDFSGDSEMIRLCVAVLRPGGTLVPAAESRDPLPITVGDFIRLELNVRGVRGSTLNDQRVILTLLQQGRITPSIHAVMPMSKIGDAHRELEAGNVTGRIVLDPWR
jgi:NADPH:quinone reductase-like Zn-dependent oxidoreductase